MLRRWLQQAHFQDEFRHLSRETHPQAASALLSAQQEAVAVLVRMMGSRPADVRLRAASKLLDFGESDSGDDLDQRLTQLEEIAKQEQEKWSWDANRG